MAHTSDWKRAHMCTVCFGRIHGSQLREGAKAGQHTPTLSLPPSHHCLNGEVYRGSRHYKCYVRTMISVARSRASPTPRTLRREVRVCNIRIGETSFASAGSIKLRQTPQQLRQPTVDLVVYSSTWCNLASESTTYRYTLSTAFCTVGRQPSYVEHA